MLAGGADVGTGNAIVIYSFLIMQLPHKYIYNIHSFDHLVSAYCIPGML